jgi:hypothetical protein
MPQTVVNSRMPKWLTEGQRASTQNPRIDGALANAFNGNAGGAILPFGRVSVLNPATRAVTSLAGAAPAANSQLIVPLFTEKFGMSLAQLITRPATDLGYPGNNPNALVEYIVDEDVVMWTEVSVQAGQQVHYRHTAAGGNTVLGRVRNAADASNTATLGTAYFAESRTGAGLVAVTLTGLVRV